MVDSTAPAFGYRSTAEEVAAAYGSSLTGKTVIVTGAFGGLGKECARVFAKYGAHVILAVRNTETGAQTAQEIISSTGNPNVQVMLLDLASLASIRAFVEAFNAKNAALHYLINNAAVMSIPERKTTADGFEMQFGTNHVGHFYLTNLLAPVLIKSAPSRVVTVSSIGHKLSPIVFDDINLETSYEKWRSYGQSKTANALFALELNDRLKAHGVTSTSLHPGGIMTNLQRDLTHDEMVKRGWISSEGKVHELFKSIEEGTSTHMYAALYPNADEIGGKYLDNCAVGKPEPHAADKEAAVRLWEVTEKLVGQTFSY